jgi:hypothetical protein
MSFLWEKTIDEAIEKIKEVIDLCLEVRPVTKHFIGF